MLSDLHSLNRNPFRAVNASFTPGEEFGYANLILEVDEQRPWTMFAGYANDVPAALGEHRLNFGAQAGNLWKAGHTLAYQYTTTSEFEGLEGHALIYGLPIPGTPQQVNFTVAHSEADLDLRAVGEVLKSGGVSSQASVEWFAPLPAVLGITQQLLVGVDFKSSNNNLEFGGLQVIDTTAETLQFAIGHEGEFSSDLGETRFSQRLVWSPGDLTPHNSDETFADLRGLGSADYVYWNGRISHRLTLPWDFQLGMRVEGQLSNANLLPAETMIVGGEGSVRGFEQNVTRADRGVVTNLELYPPGACDAENCLRPHAFFDYATGSNVDLLPDEPASLSAGAVGLGADYVLDEHLRMRAAYGWQIIQSGFEDEDHGRWHFYAMCRW